MTDEKRLNVFIVDDTVYERNRSKNVELLSWVYDHSRKVFVRGFRLLTLGWNDGNTFVPAGFCLLPSADGASASRKLAPWTNGAAGIGDVCSRRVRLQLP